METLTFNTDGQVGIGLWLDKKKNGGVTLLRSWQTPCDKLARPPEQFELTEQDWAALLLHGIREHLPAMLKVTREPEGD